MNVWLDINPYYTNVMRQHHIQLTKNYCQGLLKLKLGLRMNTGFNILQFYIFLHLLPSIKGTLFRVISLTFTKLLGHTIMTFSNRAQASGLCFCLAEKENGVRSNSYLTFYQFKTDILRV